MNRFKSRLTAVAALTLVTSFFSPIKADAQPLPACTMSIPYSNITFTGTGAGEVICLLGNNITVDALGGDDTVIDYGDNNHIFLGEGFDVYVGGYGQGGDVDGGAGNDYLVGSSLADDLDGGSGDDTIIGAAGDDTLNGGLGADDLYGDAGADSISGESGADSLDGGDGADLINGGDGDDTLIGAAGDDTLNGGLGADDLSGDIGNDALMGESGTDSLSGGDGDDVLAGGQDIDVIIGGAGLNVCDYDTGEALTATCKYDDDVPLASIPVIAPATVDSTTSASNFKISFNVKDQLGLKEGSMLCQQNGANGLIYTPVELYFDSKAIRTNSKSTKILGSALTGSSRDLTFDVDLQLRKGMYPGQYNCALSVTDLMNHNKIYRNSSFTVVRGQGDFDDSPPTVTILSITPNPVDSADSDKSLTISWHVDDPNDSVGQVQCVLQTKGTYFEAVNLAWWDSGSVMDYRGGPGAKAVNRTSTHTEFTATVTIPKDYQPGKYTCGGRQTDLIGNTEYSNNLATFDIINSSGVYDETAPVVIADAQNNQQIDVGSATKVAKIAWTITDETAYSWGYVACVHSTDSGTKILDGVTNMTSFHDYGARKLTKSITGTAREANYEVSFDVPLGTKPGRYVCQASLTDSLGHWGNTKVAEITVFRTPAGQPSSPQSLSFSASKPTIGTLSWSAPTSLGEPALSAYVFEYSTDGVAWQALPKSGTKTTSISVSGLKPDSEYWFRVRGENGGTVGQDTNFMSLNWATTKATTPKPVVADTPQNLVISDVSTNGYKLSWSAPAYNGGSTVTDYRVEVSSDAGKTWKTAKQTESTSTSLTVSGALPGTAYQIRIAAVNGVGASTWLVGNTTTLVAKPSSPRNLTTSKVAATSLTASWSLPTTNGGAPISDYQLELSSNNGSTWTTVNDGVSNNLAINLTGLLKNRAYLLRVSAVNSAGVGPASATVSVSTLATVATAPTAFSASEVQSASATVAWSAPTDFGGVNLSDYRVETSVDGKTWQVISKTASVSRSLKLNGLAPGTTYQVRLAAINSVGASAFLTGSFKTLATAPSSPRSLAATNVTTNSMSVSWLIPSTNGGSPLIDYQVELAANCSNYAVVADGVSVNLGVQLSGLKPGLRYCVRVSAQNAVGTSPSSQVLEVKTLDNKPSSPTALAVKPATTSIVLSWAKSVVLNGSPISDYVIEYSSNNGVSWLRINDGQSSKTSATVSGLKSKRTYLFRVSAVNLAGASLPSKTLKVTTK